MQIDEHKKGVEMRGKTFVSLVLLLLQWSMIHAQPAAEAVNFPGARGDTFAYVEQVSASLQKPSVLAARMPAVVILHGSGGIDGRGAFYANALNKAGFVTLEIFMFAPGARNREGHESTLTHAYGGLNYLAARSDINPDAIGVMGFSWGANMTLKLASQKVKKAFASSTGASKFSALVALYPVCWQHTRAATNTTHPTYGSYAEFTGAPVMLFAGGKDDYGTPDECQKFVDTVAPVSKGVIKYQFYPDATHGWDSPPGTSRTINDTTANQGKGGMVRMFPDSRIAADSRAKALAFFEERLKASAKP
jgi:uncharacterized protein